MAGTIYTATFSAVSVSAAQDLFEIVAPTASPIFIREIRFGQYSDAGDSQAELLSVLLMRGHTTTGSGGAALTPVAMLGGTSLATVARNNTTVATSGSPETLMADAWNIQAGWYYPSDSEMRIAIGSGIRFVVRITAPADAITMNGTLTWEEGR
jgi:hypothetical protein